MDPPPPPHPPAPDTPPDPHPLIDALSPAPRRRFAWRILLGCVIVLLASGGTTAVAVLEQVHTFAQDLRVNKPLKVDSTALAHSYYGGPETLLMVGDDTRSGFKYYNRFVPNLANEMLLVRIDPSEPWISMMSVPRELWVPITPPNGDTYTNRLNSAYTFGATTLVNTIYQLTGIRPNHVIATTFGQFEKAINTLGCVYATIDERYYHSNADGGAQYQNIDLQPGYQCLNGSEAEQFVSYRHTDTSQIRDARDQAFLLAVKQQYGPEVAGNLGRFERIFGRTVQTDSGLRSQTEILNLANLLISSAGLRVRQVPFQASACGVTCPAGDLTATQEQIQQSVNDFLYGRDITPSRQIAAIGKKVRHAKVLAHLPLTQTLAANLAAEKATAAKLQFTAEFPKVQDLAGSDVPVAPQCTQVAQACIRSYLLHAPDGDAYPTYVEVFSTGDLGQYYDVQGTTWTGAPLFNDPNQTLHVGRRAYDLYYDGSHLETIAWRQHHAVYWVHNTLTDAVGNGELLAIAEQTAPVTTVRVTPSKLTLKAFSVPTLKVPAIRTPLVQSIGRIGGLLTIVLLPLGLLAVFTTRGRIRSLRAQVHAAVSRAAVLETQVASASAAYGQTVTHGGPARLRGAAPVRYERYRSRRPWAWLAGAVGLVVAAAAVYLALELSAVGQKTKARIEPAPTAAVAVLNAGSVPQAAHRLAVRLARRRVHVVGTGNLGTAAPAGYEILYTPGDARQARLLAIILKAQHPLVAATNPAATQAAGARPKLVVVIP
jgi:LCP family protein required for cell wall assembly